MLLYGPYLLGVKYYSYSWHQNPGYRERYSLVYLSHVTTAAAVMANVQAGLVVRMRENG